MKAPVAVMIHPSTFMELYSPPPAHEELSRLPALVPPPAYPPGSRGWFVSLQAVELLAAAGRLAGVELGRVLPTYRSFGEGYWAEPWLLASVVEELLRGEVPGIQLSDVGSVAGFEVPSSFAAATTIAVREYGRLASRLGGARGAVLELLPKTPIDYNPVIIGSSSIESAVWEVRRGSRALAKLLDAVEEPIRVYLVSTFVSPGTRGGEGLSAYACRGEECIEAMARFVEGKRVLLVSAIIGYMDVEGLVNPYAEGVERLTKPEPAPLAASEAWALARRLADAASSAWQARVARERGVPRVKLLDKPLPILEAVASRGRVDIKPIPRVLESAWGKARAQPLMPRWEQLVAHSFQELRFNPYARSLGPILSGEKAAELAKLVEEWG